MKKIVTTFTMVMFTLSMMAIANAGDQPAPSDYCVTAAKANNMVANDGAILIDCRTLEEYYWVGNPADADGEPIAYNIPYKLWTSRIDCETDKPILRTVEHFFGFFIRRTFPDKDTPLILMCRSGKRSSDALTYLYLKGYKKVYEIDNYRKEEDADGGGRGGFQGSSSDRTDSYIGYRGWPNRNGDISIIQNPDWEPTLVSQSVSWMDTGLPITQKLDCSKIWLYMWRR